MLVQSITSLISAGTERMLVDFGRSGYLEKARQQPEKVKMVLNKVKTDGLVPTINAVRSKLDQPIPMGYSNVGRVVEVGSGVSGFKVGNLVLSNGSHAEYVSVPQNLCAKVPEGISTSDAVFGVVGAIALQGIRIAAPTMGENFVVTGLGLIGLMTVQLLRAQGCRVLGVDFDENKLALAQQYGADVVDLSAGEDPISAAECFSRGRGVDGVILTASTKSSDPVHQGATMCRQRGRIVLVGVTGLELNRADFYEKELSFQVSCSYGPGRYDHAYEEGGADYPFGFVRWTEQRNFEAVLDVMAAGGLSLDALKTKKFEIEAAPKAYDLLLEDKGALGVLLTYPEVENADDTISSRTIRLNDPTPRKGKEWPILAAIGAGNYAGRRLLPCFSKCDAELKVIASSGGVSGSHYGKKLGFQQTTTDTDVIFSDPEVDGVIIGTQHNSHAGFAVKALENGKSVFVEKPLGLTIEELDKIEKAYEAASEAGASPILMVGFNRRFAPMVQKLKATLVKSQEPMSMIYTCNAGSIPTDSWVQDLERGGGRIIGEACHFIDLARFLAGSPIAKIQAVRMLLASDHCFDTATITIEFESGSIAAINYFANGHNNFPKEQLTVFQNGKTFFLDNYRSLKGYGPSFSSRTLGQDKGQVGCCKAFCNSLRSGDLPPIAVGEIFEVAKASIDVHTMIREA
nr:bi-domain-containing oxidoreductase [Kordiimonas aquimaris]